VVIDGLVWLLRESRLAGHVTSREQSGCCYYKQDANLRHGTPLPKFIGRSLAWTRSASLSMVKILVRPLARHPLMQVCYCCFSYTRTSEIPARVSVTVSVLPWFERTCRLELMTLPPFMFAPTPV